MYAAPATATPPSPPPASPPPEPSRAGEGTLRAITSRGEVALTGPRVDARPGDWILENAGKVAVVSAHSGRVVDFGAAGGEDALVGLEPIVSVGIDDRHGAVVSVAPVAGAAAVLRIERQLGDPALRLWTFVSFAGPTLRIESVATSSGPAAPLVSVGEVVAWGNVPTWIEGHGFAREGGSFSGAFLAREGFGVAYALGREGAPVGVRLQAPSVGFYDDPRTGEEAVSVPAGGASPRRAVRLAHAAGRLGDAVAALLGAQGEALEPVTLPPVPVEGAWAEVAACAPPAAPQEAPFARFALSGQPRVALLPRGCFRVRAEAPGHAPGAWTPVAEAAHPGPAFAPRAGRLVWRARDRGGAALPARAIVRGVPPTPDPDWGEEPHDGAALDIDYTLGQGDVALPPGAYRVTITRGFEYTADERTVAIAAGRKVTLDAVLDRVVDTRGRISADLHVHAVPSPDAPTLLEDRVRSLAASGVEVAVATDHNAVTDYGPTIRALHAERWLASIVGDEVTTRGVELGHFNVFPLDRADAPIPFENTTPHDLFAAARAAAPASADKIVQVNHPRMGRIGHFEILRFDPGDFAGWRARTPLFDPSFDALEVYNGDEYSDRARVEACLRDWYALLDAGLPVTATGNSDSHRLAVHEAGVPRNFVRVQDDAPEAFDAPSFIEAVRRGRVVVSSGPFVDLRAGAAGGGDEVAPGKTEIAVRVQAPPWVDVSTVDLVKRGAVVHTWHVDRSSAPVRLDARWTVDLAQGDWILAIARGEAPMTPLYRPGALPFAFTNPIRAR